jgi:hypothetical protein|tara:strand:+ start:142 stop:561 length:420 start_codon:yes stop_codon:yes gene_type:complete
LTLPFFIAIISGGISLKMTVKMMLLKTGETLICDAKEVAREEQVRGYLLENPHCVNTQEKNVLTESDTGNSNYEIDVVLTPWLILSSDHKFVVSADYIATICEPISSVKEMFLKKTENALSVEGVQDEIPLSPTEIINE